MRGLRQRSSSRLSKVFTHQCHLVSLDLRVVDARGVGFGDGVALVDLHAHQRKSQQQTKISYDLEPVCALRNAHNAPLIRLVPVAREKCRRLERSLKLNTNPYPACSRRTRRQKTVVVVPVTEDLIGFPEETEACVFAI